MTSVPELPDYVRRRLAALGADGQTWLEELPERVQALESMWNIRMVGESLTGGSESLAVRVMREDGSSALLKIGIPGCDLAQEARVYQLAAGQGYATLHAHHPGHNALLLEWLGTSLERLGLSAREEMAAICDTLQTAWRPMSSDQGLTTGAGKARWLREFITTTWEQLHEPCSGGVVERALGYLDLREAAFDPAGCVLVHGDCHAGNTLVVPGSENALPPRFKFVDPDGLFAEPAYDLAMLMRDWNAELLAGDAAERGRARSEWLAGRTGVDATAIRQWGFVERVSTGLMLTRLAIEPDASQTLAVAEAWAAGDAFSPTA